MNLRKLLTILSLTVVGLGVMIGTASATGEPPEYVSGTFNCNQVTFTYDTYYSTTNFRVVDGDGNVISETVTSEYNAVATLTIQLDPAQEPGTVLTIQID